VVVMLVLAACGGGSPTPTPGGSPTPAGATATLAGTQAPGQPIGQAEIQNSFNALHQLDSYTYNGAYFTGYSGVGTYVVLHGTQRETPTSALDSTADSVDNDDTTEDQRAQYIRIGNDIWVNSGDPDFFYYYDATDPSNGALIAQYDPYALALQIAQSSGAQLQYQPMGDELVNGLSSTHYGLSQADRDQLIEQSGLDPQVWAGDIWLAKDGGYVTSIRFGPVMQGETLPISGFIWDTTSINCECPVNPPSNAASPSP
jgi:hypothetical protein